MTLIHWRLVGVALLWAGTFIAGRKVAAHAPHAIVAALRFVIAAACLLPLLAWRSGTLAWPSRDSLGWCAALAVTGMLAYNLFFLGALAHLDASRTSLIVALNPIITLLIAVALGLERLSARRVAGVAVAFGGVATILSRGELASLWQGGIGRGELLMFGGALSWAAYTLIGQRAMQSMSSLVATTWSVTLGAIMLLGVALPALPTWLAQGGAADPLVWAAAAYLGIGGSVIAFVWYSDGVRELGAARTAVFNNLVPVFGVALAVLLLGEALHWSMIAGGALAIAGVVLATRTESVPVSASAQSASVK